MSARLVTVAQPAVDLDKLRHEVVAELRPKLASEVLAEVNGQIKSLMAASQAEGQRTGERVGHWRGVVVGGIGGAVAMALLLGSSVTAYVVLGHQLSAEQQTLDRMGEMNQELETETVQ